MRKIILLLLLFIILLLKTEAQYTTLHNFSAGEGTAPRGSLIYDGTYFYGMSTLGGTNGGWGTVFKMKPDGTGFSILLTLGGNTYGKEPYGSLISDGVFLYGMTYVGGNYNCGTIFKIKFDGTGYSKLLDFTGTTNGCGPYGSLIYDGIFLYGMTYSGGTNNLGTIFKIKTDGTAFTKLLDFNGTTNGSYPSGSLTSDGNYLYGMTKAGGANDLGSIFKINTDGTGYFKLLDFAGITNGSNPLYGSLIYDGTYFYGMTELGGNNNYGTIFKIKPDGTGYLKLLDFDGTSNGRNPSGSLIIDGSYLYGMTVSGGTNNKGTIFKINSDGAGYLKLLDFTGSSSGFYPNGFNPYGSLISDGTYLYSMTSGGGTYNDGTIFKCYKYCNTLDDNITSNDIICNGSNNGSAIANASGGMPPYTYQWSTTPVQTTPVATGLIAGTYTITVTETNGCSNTKNITINQPPAITYNLNNKMVACYGGNDGASSIINIINGVPPYTYLWSTTPVQTTQTATGLTAGSFNITVTDSNNCSITQSITITQPTLLTDTITSTRNTKCVGVNNGTATVIANGGTPPYTYLWNSLAGNQTTSTAIGLYQGIYNVLVTDSNGCTKNTNVTVNHPVPITATYTPSLVTKCSGPCNGTLFVNASGGTPPYTYQWDSLAANQTTATINNLCVGTYGVKITDTNGCTLNKQINLTPSSVINPQLPVSNVAAVDQVNVDPAFASYYSYDLPATIITNSTNSLNLVDPGKYVRFRVQSKNKKTSGLSMVNGHCLVETNSPYLTLTDSLSNLNNIAWNAKAWSTDEFEIYIKPNTPAGSNVYLDFVVEENGTQYPSTCIAIPITPLIYSPPNANTVNDDNNGDSHGNNNGICNPGETIEFYPFLNSITNLNAQYVKGTLTNLDNLNYINIWNNHAGASGTVYNSSWWNYAFGYPGTIPARDTNMSPEFDFVFDYTNSVSVNNFKLYHVLEGGFLLFPTDTVLSLVKWSIPYTFNNTSSTDISESQFTSSLIIYPNPFTSQTTISFAEEQKKSTIKIMDMLGKEIKSVIFSGKQLTIEKGEMKAGMYTIQIIDKNRNILNKKIIVQ